MKTGSIKKNLIYNTVYQILTTFTPLITTPWLARSLGNNQQGVFSTVHAVMTFFNLIASFGGMTHSIRVVSVCSDDKKRRSIVFWNMFVLQFVISFIALLFYLIYVLFICKKSIVFISLLFSLTIIGGMFNISWFFFGMERFDITVKRNVVVRFLSIVMIIFFIKEPSDLWKYVLISSGAEFFSGIFLWKNIFKYINFSDIKEVTLSKIKMYIKPNFILFIPSFAMYIYNMTDKVMLGYFSSESQQGFYYSADKIITIPITIIFGFGSVMMPRMSKLVKQQKKEEIFKLFNISLEIFTFLSVAMSLGIVSISKEFVPVFLTNEYLPCIDLIFLLFPYLILKSLSNVVRTQFMIPNNIEKKYIKIVVISSLLNFIINLCLIPKIGATGAVIGTLISEFFVCTMQFCSIKGLISFKGTLLKCIVYLIFGIVMFICVRFISHCIFGIISNAVLGLIIEIIFGGIIYLGLCFLYWYITKSPYISMCFGFLKRKKHN